MDINTKITQMIYKIHEITNDFIIGSVQDKIRNYRWIVVADIPRQMTLYNRVQPQNISLISGESDEDFSHDFERVWTLYMVERLRNWLIIEHPEKLFSYRDQPISINNNFI
ncbi:hypothetical protein [Elizabethkingia miricola]|uniref:hypothetical protein n=1 Tax=Elizabethkingia miricola TaxID=172045 RepID=UPI000B27CE26|nr:hypothetical protein [Elizabethkingia miricola]